MTRTVSLSRSRSSSLMISPWKLGWLNPSTMSCTGPIAICIPQSSGRAWYATLAHKSLACDGGAAMPVHPVPGARASHGQDETHGLQLAADGDLSQFGQLLCGGGG